MTTVYEDTHPQGSRTVVFEYDTLIHLLKNSWMVYASLEGTRSKGEDQNVNTKENSGHGTSKTLTKSSKLRFDDERRERIIYPTWKNE